MYRDQGREPERREVHRDRAPVMCKGQPFAIQLSTGEGMHVKKASKDGRELLKGLEVTVPGPQIGLKTVPVSTSQTENHQDSHSIG